MYLGMLRGQKVAWYSESAAGTRILMIRVSIIGLSGMNLEVLRGRKVAWCSESAAVRE